MIRKKITPREDYKKKLEDLSFNFHSLDNVYWDESAYYEFSSAEIDVIEKATNELWQLCLKAVAHVIGHKLYDRLKIFTNLIPLIERSWYNEEPSFYGRFDLAYNGTGVPKLLEFNADTPTSLYEAAVVQWYWMQDTKLGADQFNSIHEKLTAYWKGCLDYFNGEAIHFTCVKDSIEDFTTTEYIRDVATQSGFNTSFLYLDDIGWNKQENVFTDIHDNVIKNIFKLYPWEWLSNEKFGDNLSLDATPTKWIEPAWKAILSNKAILPLLYELFPDSPYILECYDTYDERLTSWVRKPIYSREGANIIIRKNGEIITETDGEYGEEGYIYQDVAEIPNFENNYPVIGSWVIDQQSAGIGIRESGTMITDNLSRFIPHVIKL